MTSHEIDAEAKTRFGRPTFGSSQCTLIWASLLCGVIVDAAIVAVAHWVNHPDKPLLFAGVVFVATLPSLVAGAWLVMVDRDTIAGAVKDTENTVESRWYDEAAKTALHTMMWASGIGAAVLSLFFDDLQVPAWVACVVVILVIWAAFGARYAVERRRDTAEAVDAA